jgi:hypothetical protein
MAEVDDILDINWTVTLIKPESAKLFSFYNFKENQPFMYPCQFLCNRTSGMVSICQTYIKSLILCGDKKLEG